MEFLAQFGDDILMLVVGAIVLFYMRGRFELLERRLDGPTTSGTI